MGRFTISKPYTMPRKEIRAAAEELADRISQKHGVQPRWKGDSVSMAGKGIEGSVNFEGNTIDVSVKLGLLASPFEGVVKREIQQYLDKHIT